MSLKVQYITSVLVIISALVITNIICTDSSNYGRSNGANAWTSDYQQSSTQHKSGFSTSTPWPALGATNNNNNNYGNYGQYLNHHPQDSNRRNNQNNNMISDNFTNYAQYTRIVNAALPDPQWIQQRYNSNNRGRYAQPSYQNGNSQRDNYAPYYNNNQYDSSGPSTNTNSENRNSLDVTDNELREFSETLLNKDNSSAARLITVNYQGRTSSRSQADEAPLPLITVNDAQLYTIPSVSKLKRLFDNYVLRTNVAEESTYQEKEEEDDFLDVILTTSVMEYTRDFLMRKGRVGRNPSDFKNLLKEIWFKMYPRGGRRVGSSGFEHVFLAEIRNNQISGLHNWVYFNEEEKNSNANYLGYMKKIEFGNKGGILKQHFTYHGIDKPVGSMFIGTSPELEMALYTTCFMLRADKVCPLKLGGNRFIIRTFTYHYQSKNFIGSAFPEI